MVKAPEGGFMRTSLHEVRFPGESDSYRVARDELLDAEITMRRPIESVAAKRRALPPGGEVREDYVFEEQGTWTQSGHSGISSTSSRKAGAKNGIPSFPTDSPAAPKGAWRQE